jgi:predicted nucleotidyltransferase
MLNKREDLDKLNNIYTYYITVNIDGKDKEIEYNGKNFNNIKLGNKIVLIEYMFLNKQAYLCYSYDEINKI